MLATVAVYTPGGGSALSVQQDDDRPGRLAKRADTQAADKRREGSMGTN